MEKFLTSKHVAVSICRNGDRREQCSRKPRLQGRTMDCRINVPDECTIT
jgi:hypothetical protein